MRSRISATGSFVPVKREDNKAVESALGLESGWSESRTGIASRAIADKESAVSDLAIQAGKPTLDRLANSADHLAPLTTLILATSTPDHLLPPTAPRVADELGLSACAAMDVTVACSGFLYATILADSICRSQNESVLIIAANILSRRCKPTDKTTRPIFADAAGAIVLSPTDSKAGILAHSWESDGSKWDKLLIPEGGSRHPVDEDTHSRQGHLMELVDGQAMFKYAVNAMAKLGQATIEKAKLSITDIDWWIPHQANMRIIEACGRILGIEPERTLTTVQELGNSSSATIPVTLDKFAGCGEQQKIGAGDTVLMTAAAAGATSAAVVLQM